MLAPDRLPHVVVVGAGLMGAQIGCEYALGGHPVVLVGRRPESARKRAEQALATVERYGLHGAEEIGSALSRITVVGSLEEVDSADLIVESVPEDFELKAEVLGRAAAAFPNGVVATNTSSLSVTALGEAIGAPERTLGTHYWNPPLLMPLVELVAGDATAAEALDGVEGALRALGKRPVRVHDVPGFVWNRLQLALLREAVWVVEHGVATPEAVDEIVRSGLARRWRSTGPFETVGLGGAATFGRVAANLFPVLSGAQRAGGLARWTPKEPGALAAAKARRDAALAGEIHRERREGTA
ncbi:MAG: 3-hydroxyacyl-CoA dehydrogenase family protein [Thermoleophilia bacterium]|nr:3-hydroxyacyl-CoA dehydrogenase family protein [Thermoleophilia bacterium]